MRLPLVLAALAVMLLGASCGQKHEPIGALPPFPQQADDAMGREVKVLQAPKRVVSLDPGITEAAFTYGGMSRPRATAGRARKACSTRLTFGQLSMPTSSPAS